MRFRTYVALLAACSAFSALWACDDDACRSGSRACDAVADAVHDIQVECGMSLSEDVCGPDCQPSSGPTCSQAVDVNTCVSTIRTLRCGSRVLATEGFRSLPECSSVFETISTRCDEDDDDLSDDDSLFDDD